MKLLVVLTVAFLAAAFTEASYRSYNEELTFPLELMFNDPQATGDCKFGCNSQAHVNNKCEDGQCTCAKGFGGKYCTCEGLCTSPFGSCDNDAAGSCTCTSGYKGRNCNCPVTCPDTDNWFCTTTIYERGCVCKVDGLPWQSGKKCCPTACTNAGMSCPKDDGVCYCPHDNKYIPYGSPVEDYKCCAQWCAGPMCECRNDGCIVKATGVKATKQEQCQAPQPKSCSTPGSWEECGDHHWQGRCVCNPQNPSDCRCKCWFGWAGGDGVYAKPGWEKNSASPVLYADHCRNHCDWTHDYQPSYCAKCKAVDCPNCKPTGSKKCDGTHPDTENKEPTMEIN